MHQTEGCNELWKRKTKKSERQLSEKGMKQLGLVNLHLLYDCGFELIPFLQQLVAFVRKRDKRMEAYKVSRSTLNSVVHYFGL